MNSESFRIADQLRRAFTGEAWHGSSVRELLSGVTPEQARARPLPPAHTIWELVLHIDVWVHAAIEATQGVAIPKEPGADRDWPAVGELTAAIWNGTQKHLFQNAEQLAKAIEGFSNARLADTVPGREYDFYYLFHGIVQHSLYHGGQIAMLKTALAAM